MRIPQLALTAPAKGPFDGLWEKLNGQFWIKAALFATDLPEGPSRATPRLLGP
jgi:hypothetical protein